MTSFLGRPQTSVRLGELLVQAGMLTQIQLQEAVRHSKGKRLQIGQVLIMFGYLSPRDLQSALEAQSVLRDKSVDYNLALRCLKIAYKIGGSFKDILQDHEGGTSQKKTPTSKLGELLVEAGVINNDQLTRAIEESLATGLPLGRMLVLHQSVTPEALKTALDVQTRLRDEMLTREEALTAIREAGGLDPHAPGDEAKVHASAMPSLRKKGIRLGELLVLAGVITESDVMTALEAGLLKHQPLGQALVSQNIASQDILDAALTLQSEVDEGRLEPLAAAECLTKCHTTGVTPQEAMKERGTTRPASKAVINYEKLLTLARVVSPEDIGAAFDISSKSSQIIGKVLVLTGYMEVSTLQATLRCYQLLSKGLITQDDAVATLDYCLHQPEGAQLTFDQALHELGWIGKKELTMTGEKQSETFAQEEEESAAERLQKLLDSIPPPPSKSAEFDVPSTRPEPKAADIPASKNTTLSNIPARPPETAQDLNPTDTSNSLPAQSISLTASTESGEAATAADIIFDGLIQDTFDKKSDKPDKAPRQEMSRKFAQTILPEDAKAKQLAMMVSREVHGSQNLNPEEESDAVYDAFSRLAQSYSEQGNYAESQHVYERILVHRLNQFGPNHPILVQEFVNLAGVLCAQEKFNQAEPFMRRAVAVLETAHAEEVKLAECLNLLGMIYFRQEKLTDAEKTLVRTIELRRAHLGANHPDLALALNDYARVLKKQGQNDEAEKAYTTAKAILGGS